MVRWPVTGKYMVRSARYGDAWIEAAFGRDAVSLSVQWMSSRVYSAPAGRLQEGKTRPLAEPVALRTMTQ
jgi:hypothetical protein